MNRFCGRAAHQRSFCTSDALSELRIKRGGEFSTAASAMLYQLVFLLVLLHTSQCRVLGRLQRNANGAATGRCIWQELAEPFRVTQNSSSTFLTAGRPTCDSNISNFSLFREHETKGGSFLNMEWFVRSNIHHSSS